MNDYVNQQQLQRQQQQQQQHQQQHQQHQHHQQLQWKLQLQQPNRNQRLKGQSKGSCLQQNKRNYHQIMIQDKMVRARRQYHHQPPPHQQQQSNHHRHPLGHNGHHFYRHNKRNVPNAPSNTTQFIMNDHELIEPDFDLMHNAIMEHYNRNKKRKISQDEQHQQSNTSSNNNNNKDRELQSDESPSKQRRQSHSPEHESIIRATTPKESTTTTPSTEATKLSPSRVSRNQEQQRPQANQQQPTHYQHQQLQQQSFNLVESTKSNPTTPSYRPTGSPGDEDGMSPFINHEHLQSEFQEVYTNIHTERLSSMSKIQLVNQYLLLEERVEELENQLRESQTQMSASSHG